MKKRLLQIIIPVLFYQNVSASDFSTADNIVSNGISMKAFPGAQLLIGTDKDVLYNKSYGNFTYDEFSAVVTNESMFDIASVTKVVATTSAIMKLYQEGRLNLSDKVISFIPDFSNNGKEDITILNLLVHNSGLKAFVPFYKSCRNENDVINTICRMNLDYPVNSKFVYSDLNAILLGVIVEKVSGMGLDEYCKVNIFEPLDMNSTMFIPDERMKEKILPTEYDNYWRNRLIQGEVHDEAASVMGGVSGNAGLFSNASDLYNFMKMMLNNGVYYNPYTRGLTEEKIFNPEVINLFVKNYADLSYESSRALGWDTKPKESSAKYRIPCGELISENCFGHTGFTGTSVWCDRERNLIIIFLTNRVYPSRDNFGIRDIRPDIHNAAIQIASNQN